MNIMILCHLFWSKDVIQNGKRAVKILRIIDKPFESKKKPPIVEWSCTTVHLFVSVIYWLITVAIVMVFVWLFCRYDVLGAVSIRKTVLPGMAIPMLKIRRPNGRLIFNMEIAIRR